MSPLEILGQLLHTLVACLPRLLLVRKTHGAVVFQPGGRTRELGPGLHWWWPITSEVETIITTRQTQSFAAQSLQTKNGMTVSATAMLVYSVCDVHAALVKCWNVDEVLADVAASAVAEILGRANASPALLARTEKPLTTLARSRLRPFGIHVLRCCLVDLAPCRVLRCITDTGQPVVAEND